VKITVPKKNTLFGPKLEFMGIIGTKMRPTYTTKGAQGRIIWLLIIQNNLAFDYTGALKEWNS
jgi:hypothetical protein